MIKPRVLEKNHTVLGQVYAEAYDRMQATFRDKGWLETGDLLLNGIVHGFVLEVGSGPGHLGLEWLLGTRGTGIIGLDINPNMVLIARNHARELKLADRAQYLLGSAEAMPFACNAFDAVITSRSLHEWLYPRAIFTELWKVLKPGGRIYISDLRRNLSRSACNFLERRVGSELILESLRTSIDAAYTIADIADLLKASELSGCEVIETTFGLRVTGIKPL